MLQKPVEAPQKTLSSVFKLSYVYVSVSRKLTIRRFAAQIRRRKAQMNKLMMTTAMFAAMSVSAIAAEPIVGNWKTQSGETAAIAACGGAYCIKLKTGKYSGKQIGRVSGSGASYSGTITDPADDKEYSGAATISGSSMALKGCALKIFCKTQNWTKM
jgi:uncharacterized protein (DUF2147 family)